MTRRKGKPRSPRRARAAGRERRFLARADASLLDLADSLLAKGVVLTGDVMLGVAEVDLIYLRLSLLLCAADRVFSRGAPR